MCCQPEAASTVVSPTPSVFADFGASVDFLGTGSAPGSENTQRYAVVGAPGPNGAEGEGELFLFAIGADGTMSATPAPAPSAAPDPSHEQRFASTVLAVDLMDCYLDPVHGNCPPTTRARTTW